MTSEKHPPRFVGDPLFAQKPLSQALPEHFDSALNEVVWIRDRNSPRMAVAKVRQWAVSVACLKPLQLEPGPPRIAQFPDLESLRANAGRPRTMVSMYVPFTGSAELWQWAPDDVQFSPLVGYVQKFGEDGVLDITATVAVGFESGFAAALEEYIRRIRAMLRHQQRQVERYNAQVPERVKTAFPTVGDRKRVTEALRSIRIEPELDRK